MKMSKKTKTPMSDDNLKKMEEDILGKADIDYRIQMIRDQISQLYDEAKRKEIMAQGMQYALNILCGGPQGDDKK